ncbi:MAG: acyltransferase [Acidobacteria bacterium]|nr:acyltransferase [Acidobacteriota bacterium]
MQTLSTWAPQVPRRIPSLDGLRALSILLVLVGHAIDAQEWPRLFALVGHVGNYGVRIFFVISGFLITTLLLKEFDTHGTISLRGFYIRRTLRILPAFFVYVGVIWGLYLAGVVPLKDGDLLHALTYTMNYHENRGWFLNHLWSLSVEEQFYLLWPSLFLLAGPHRAMRAAGAAIFLAPLIRAVMYFGFDASATAVSRHFQAVCDSLAFGCLLAGSYNWLGRQNWYTRLTRPTWFLAVPFLCLLIPAIAHKVHAMIFYIPGVSLVFFGITLLVDRSVRYPDDWVGRIFNWKPLMWIGTISYSIYLWQELFLDNGIAGLDIPLPLNLILTFAVSTVSYYAVELQFLRWKDRFQQDKPAAAQRKIA